MKSKIVTFGIILILLFTLVILFFSTLKKPRHQFTFDADTLMTQIIKTNNQVSQEAFNKLIINKDKNIVFVDIRSKNQYIKGHLPNAINIFKASILDVDNYKIFKELKKNKKRVILYGQDIVEANMPFMILKQTGINNIEILSKGYNYYKSDTQTDSVKTDKKELIDFAAFIIEEHQIADKKAKEVKIIIEKVYLSGTPKTKKSVKMHKRETEEEEEEGC
jgi:rhodanese-related sulfurtransferase